MSGVKVRKFSSVGHLSFINKPHKIIICHLVVTFSGQIILEMKC